MKQCRLRSAGRPRATTLREVAAEAGVSTATVSRVLAGLDGVADGARHRVTRGVAKLDYHPNRFARGLRLGHRKVIGVIIPDLRNLFFTDVVHGVEAARSRAGYTLLLGHSDGLAERERELLRMFRGEGVGGLVFTGNRPEANYESIRAWKIPMVAIDRSPGGAEVALVCSSNQEGMRQAGDSHPRKPGEVTKPPDPELHVKAALPE